METTHLKESLNVLGFQVKTFPHGIEKAFDKLIEMLPGGLDRAYYGISYVMGEAVVYIAAAIENYAGEAEQYNCDRYTIEKGDYLAVTVKDWRKKTHTIKDVFGDMLKDTCPDQDRPCIEWYKDDAEMVCLVRKDHTY